MPSYKAADFIDAIPGSRGIVSVIAERVGCTWHTARRWIDDYQTVRQAYDDERETALDYVESKAYEAIGKGDGPMIRYVLSTQGKGRGYVERQEIDNQGDVTVKVIHERDNSTDKAT